MRPHFLVLVLIPIVHGTFSLFNPFRNILPNVQYFQLGTGNNRDFDDRPHKSDAPQFTTLLERCLTKSGFYIDGYCYTFGSVGLTFDGAVAACRSQGGEMWSPDLEDPTLFGKFVEATRNLNPDIFTTSVADVWVPIKNNHDLQGNLVTNHLLSTLGSIPNCGMLKYIGAFTLINLNCDIPHAYVCQINI